MNGISISVLNNSSGIERHHGAKIPSHKRNTSPETKNINPPSWRIPKGLSPFGGVQGQIPCKEVPMIQSHFYAYMARMKYVKRWNLRRNTREENDQEHSLQVAMIAHALAVIRKKRYGGEIEGDEDDNEDGIKGFFEKRKKKK